MSLFEKFKKGLNLSSSNLSSGIKDIFSKKNIDQAVLSHFEELLVSADVGNPIRCVVTGTNGAGCEIYKNSVSGPNKVGDLAAVSSNFEGVALTVDATNNTFTATDNIVILCTDAATTTRVLMICGAESPQPLTVT